MDHSLQGCFLPQNTCKYCGAGSHNNYTHDANCLINVSVRNMKSWRMGWLMKQNGSTFGIPSARTPAVDAFRMGVRCAELMAEKKLSAEPTATSPKQGVGVYLTL